eukprot:2212269-Lingulodinium_polyedra.AAC.1
MSLTQLGLSLAGYRKFTSPARVHKSRLRVAVRVVPCPIGESLRARVSARAPVSARVGVPP